MNIPHESLEDVIRRYIVLGPRSSKGYEIVECAVCHDYKVRGGFKFEGEQIDYHCFNCGMHAKYDPTVSRHQLSSKMNEVLLAFGIPDDEIRRSVSFNFFKPATVTDQPAVKVITYPTKEVELPLGSVMVSSGSNDWCDVAEAYLTWRCLPTEFTYYVTDDSRYAGRLIIPYFFRGRIIYWQGRSMDEALEPRYKNPVVEKDNIFFNMDELFRHTNDPLFVTEGPLDALSIGQNAIALTGSTLTEFKIRELERVARHRTVIFVIDKNQNGYKLGMQALEHGWSVAVFPDNIDDANDAKRHLGQLWTVSHLAQTAADGFGGRVLLKTKCGR